MGLTLRVWEACIDAVVLAWCASISGGVVITLIRLGDQIAEEFGQFKVIEDVFASN